MLLKPLVALFFYSLFGAMIFHFMERKPKQVDKDPHFNHHQLLQHCSSSITQTIAARGDLQKDDLSAAVRANLEDCFKIALIDRDHLVQVELEPWTFAESLRYAMHVYTTVGFGNICPTSSAGRLFTIIYALFGIPLCSLVISLLSEHWVHLLRRRSGTYSYKDDVGQFHLAEVLAAISYAIIGVLVFAVYEGWSAIEAGYFTFIALSSVGFGDFVPTETPFFFELLFMLFGQALLGLYLQKLAKYYANAL